MSGHALCRLDDIADGEGKGFGNEGSEPAILVVRQGTRVFAYVNDCPHAHITLDFIPDRFMNRDKTMILCANHGALFDIRSGACLQGPCKGKHLTPVAVAVKDGELILV